MKKILYALLFLPFLAFAQEKGVTPLPAEASASAGKGVTRAVVIGISDYQDPAIPDLRFADKDAEAFANFLRSPAGGALKEDNLKLLTNQNATGGQVVAALSWLLEVSHEGDQAIIYFSGHGDVETKLLNQLGFLLLWDSPARIYMAGALPVDMLRQVVTTLSIEQKVKVFVVVDACRAGKLAGNTVIGTQLTSNQLAQQFSLEQKILSCQPNEYSIEGEQWGGGRGVFSYYFVNGLYGFADLDHNGQVTLFEIGRYLEDYVPRDVAPLSQIPLTVGARQEPLFAVDPVILAKLEKDGTAPVLFTGVEQRGIERDLLLKADSSIRQLYAGFERTLRAKQFFEPEGDCTEYYFTQLMEVENLAGLHAALRRNYAAALQDDAQQVVNAVLKSNMQEVSASYDKIQRYGNFPKLLGRAADLLGDEHYMFAALKARQLLFEGLLLYLETYTSREEASGQAVLEKYRQSLAYQPESPLVHYYMSLCFSIKLNQPDSAIVHARTATRYAQTWASPYAHTGFNLVRYNKQFESAKTLIDKALGIDSANCITWLALGAYYFYQSELAHAVNAYHRATEMDSTSFMAWANLGTAYLSMDDTHTTEAETAFRHAQRLNPQSPFVLYALGCLYSVSGRDKEAEEKFLQVIVINPKAIDSRDSLYHIYLRQNRLKEAETVCLDLTRLNPARGANWYRLSGLAAIDGRHDEALEHLEKAFKNEKFNLDEVQKDPWLVSLHDFPTYKAMLKKYFPDQYKD